MCCELQIPFYILIWISIWSSNIHWKDHFFTSLQCHLHKTSFISDYSVTCVMYQCHVILIQCSFIKFYIQWACHFAVFVQNVLAIIGPWYFLFFFFFFWSFIFISWRLITSQHCSGFGHTLTWISHGPWYFQLHLESAFHKTGPTSVFIGTTLHLQKVMERIDVFQYLVY